MGCKHSTSEAQPFEIEEQWKMRGFPPVSLCIFENSSERTIFMAINLIRTDPSWVIPHVQRLQHHKRYTGANIKIVLDRLKATKPLPMLEINETANMACRKVNAMLSDQPFPSCNNNRIQYRETPSIVLLNPDINSSECMMAYRKASDAVESDHTTLNPHHKSIAVNEYTEIGWEGPTDELAIFMLIGGC